MKNLYETTNLHKDRSCRKNSSDREIFGRLLVYLIMVTSGSMNCRVIHVDPRKPPRTVQHNVPRRARLNIYHDREIFAARRRFVWPAYQQRFRRGIS